MKKGNRCWHFVMSSFVRSYGRIVISNKRFHEIALKWCDDNNCRCDIHLDDLGKVDIYFRKYYEEFE
jgi:hypothetical protein